MLEGIFSDVSRMNKRQVRREMCGTLIRVEDNARGGALAFICKGACTIQSI